MVVAGLMKNVMDQYRPCFRAHTDPRTNRPPSTDEVGSVYQYAREKGLTLIA